jgi:hypothetical protein
MLQSGIIDVVIGLIFTFCAVSLAVSAITEALATAFNWRAKNLLDGVASLLNDDKVTGLALAMYNHALVNPQSSGTAASKTAIDSKPSYIDPKQFASALTDLVGIGRNALTATNDQISAAIGALPNDQLKTALQGMANRANGDLATFRSEIASWFDTSMDRVSGQYKRHVQFWSFGIAMILCLILNIDALRVAKTLWEQPTIAAGIAASAGANKDMDATAAVQQLERAGLPIGWSLDPSSNMRTGQSGFALLTMILGWLITALSTLFGAPFWFDALQRITRLAGTGPPPAQKPSQGV